jgi:hypothetical protein
MSYPYIIQGSNVTVVIGNKPYTVSSSHVTYNRLVEAIKVNDWDKVKDLIEPRKVVLNYGRGNVSVQGDQLYWRGQPMHNALTSRMIKMLQEGFDIEPLVLFMENLMKNPSKRAVDELYGFLEKNSLPITPDGSFLAYKRVRDDYLDVHSGTVSNRPAATMSLQEQAQFNVVGKNGATSRVINGETVVEMERNQVDDKAENTCSQGLHFCSQEYLKSFSGFRVVILRINPADVVSIPVDYNNSKGRTCRYTVVGEVGLNPNDQQEFDRPVQNNANNATNRSQPADTSPKGPKLGSTPFYKGYTVGYKAAKSGEEVRIHAHTDPTWSNKDVDNFVEGVDKGHNDAISSSRERYRYVDSGSTPGSWPARI